MQGEPDDLLLLAGYGFSADDTVVYAAGVDGGVTAHPATAPSVSTAAAGVAPVVSTRNLPYSLTIRLPEAMRKDQPYVLWIETHRGEWSLPATINDARPLWFSPAYIYESAEVGGLPRHLKLIGRNLQPLANAPAWIRLRGLVDISMPVIGEVAHGGLARYVARANLPARVPAGTYAVELSRDGQHWVAVEGQKLEVRRDPVLGATIAATDARFGGCKPDDGLDDTACVLRAISFASGNPGSTIVFAAGTWDLRDSELRASAADGIVLPAGVGMLGAGSALTTLVRHPEWSAVHHRPAFALMGGNKVSGFTFKDEQVYHRHDDAGPFLRLGPAATEDARSSQPLADIVVTGNTFDRPTVAIEGGLPMAGLFITHNEFGAFHEGIRLAGSIFNTHTRLRVDDSVIAYNIFKPGSSIDVGARQGAVASEIGAGHRLDFSNNTADGSAREYLNDPADAAGWRAAFFWHMENSQEQVLVSANTASCTGDKDGDGEAIVFDNNGNSFGYDSAIEVAGAGVDTLVVSGAPLAMQNDRSVPGSFYVGHWIQVGDGPGLGQVRRILGYGFDKATRLTTFRVSPAWDIVPAAHATRVNVGREVWQAYILSNTVDHRQPLCMKSNRNQPHGGVINLWAQTTDSVVAGNVQYDSDGILFQNQYSERDPACAECNLGTAYVGFTDIRDNTIDGEYAWDSGCSSSGILGSLAAGPGRPPATVNYGVTIAHNTIKRADASPGGAIALLPTWYRGPAPYRWPLVSNILIHHNDISGLWDRPAVACNHGATTPRTAIDLGSSSLVSRPVLYANRCEHVPRAEFLEGVQEPTRLCKAGLPGSCECPAQP